MRGFGAILFACSLVLLVLEHLNLIDVLGVIGLLIGLFMIIFPDKADELFTKIKSGKLK
ncbi:MAG: hypothetical protein M0R34_03985 [Candidatus Marinimicrobia bacterium]|jgi:hypothetical protein|nr:hypothetical protein [Candidatus Neomarinimicrobiota bacterium]MCK9483503.1 hypothetical protein [Candidatus Neomarinimicrobiota bacterium]MCK9559714.1 hypothetical protein [Candidatus Neomarinimicrobiota bacterium]MDD5061002.1 hypothetical protein [Candidatus Neomarinimicrobiota bacterium]MDD5230176.1 hypothetical protein [Candidatus Neomarinimicrobiota bacterium]